MSRSDLSLTQTLYSTIDATYDFLVAFFGGVFVVVLSLQTVNDAAGMPVSGTLIGAVALILALAASYPLVAGPWSIDRFTDFVLTVIITVVGLALLAAIPFLAVGGVPSDSLVAGVSQVAIVWGALVIAVVKTYVYRPLFGVV